MALTFALDYDHTYSAAPDLFDSFIESARAGGHRVIVVTARNEVLDAIEEKVLEGVEIAYCDGVAKKFCMEHYFKVQIDVWIDDKPEGILYNSTASAAVLQKWREERV